MAEVAELSQTPQFHMVKQKEGRDWTEMCLMRPLKQTEALFAEQVHPPGCSAMSKNNPCSIRKPFHPITAHSHGHGLHLPQLWTDLVAPPPQEHNLPLPPPSPKHSRAE